MIKNKKKNKSEITDQFFVESLLAKKEITGVRIHMIDSSKKCYTKTKMIYNNSTIAYILKQDSIEIVDIKEM